MRLLLPGAGLALLATVPGVSGKNILVFAGFFLLGFLIASDDAFSALIERHRRLYLALTPAGAAAVLVEMHTVGRQDGWAAASWHTAVTWVTLLAMLGYGRRYLNRRQRWGTAYANPAAFPVYILHQTVLVAAGFYILRLTDAGVMPYVLILVTSLIVSVASYEVIRRIRPLRYMFGLKTPARAAASAASAATSSPGSPPVNSRRK